MRGFSQLLADLSGRFAAFFLRMQLHFLAREKARLERLHGERITTPLDESEDITQAHVIQLLPPLPGRRHGTPSGRHSRDFVA